MVCNRQRHAYLHRTTTDPDQEFMKKKIKQRISPQALKRVGPPNKEQGAKRPSFKLQA